MVEDRRKRGPNRRLDSWKEIASYFGRDERTVKRWEKERGLPVRRLPGARGGVYAFSDDLAQWMGTWTPGNRNVREQGGGGDSTSGSRTQAPAYSHESVTVAVLEPPSPAQPEDDVTRPAVSRWPANGPFVVVSCCFLIAAVVVTLLFLRQGHYLVSTRTTGPSPASVRSVHHEPSAKAQELYLKGRYYWNKRTPADLDRARDYFTQAIAIDPEYAQAYVGLADSYNLLREYSAMPESEAYPKAIAAARKAIELDNTLAEAHNSLAFDTFYWSFDAAGAEREFRRALELNPNYALAHHWYATFLVELGRNQEALEQIEIARRLDSSSTAAMVDKGLILYDAGRTEEAVALLKQVAETEPAFLSTHRYLAMIDLINGNFRDYLAEAKKAAVLSGNNNELAIVKAGEKGLHAGGSRAMLQDILGEEKQLYSEGRIGAYRLAQTAALLGDKQEAISYLRTARERHDLALAGILADPYFVGLHGDTAYRELVSQVGLPTSIGS